MSRTLPGLVVLALACVVGGYLAGRHWIGHDRSEVSRAAPANALPSEPLAAAASADGPRPTPIPEELPDIRLPDLQGKMHSILDYGNRPVVLNFWATWCEPCRREMPLLDALHARPGPHDRQAPEVIGIAIDFRDSVAEFLAKHPVGYPLLVGENGGIEAAQRLGVELVLPFSVFADHRHRILLVKVGELHRDQADAILQALDDVDHGRIDIRAARASLSLRLRDLAADRARQGASPGPPAPENRQISPIVPTK